MDVKFIVSIPEQFDPDLLYLDLDIDSVTVNDVATMKVVGRARAYETQPYLGEPDEK